MQEKIGEFNQEHVGRNSAAFANKIGVCRLKYKEIEVSEQYYPIRGLQSQLYPFLLENLALLYIIFNCGN